MPAAKGSAHTPLGPIEDEDDILSIPRQIQVYCICDEENIPGKEPHFKKEIENENIFDFVFCTFRQSDIYTISKK